MSDETKPSAPATEAAPTTTAPADNATAAETSKESKPAEKPEAAAPATEGPTKEEAGKAQSTSLPPNSPFGAQSSPPRLAFASKSLIIDRAASKEKSTDIPATSTDVEMKDATESAPAAEGATKGESAPAHKEAEASQVATPDKTKARRKSTGGGASAKKLNKKASKARITHTDAKPGDHFFVKLKGFPQWPAIICDEDMLPKALLDSRPVTAKRIDGTYRDDFADGGKRVGDRSFPVMYLHTNEFGWVSNTDLIELDTETVLEVKMDKMRKDLQAAYRLASENHPISHYKSVLQDFQEELLAKQKAKEAKSASGKKNKKKEEEEEAEEDEDVEMADAGEDGAEAAKEKKASKKRKAEENIETPQRSDSVKKPKIKLTTNSTPKANGTPKPSKAGSESKSSKPKSKKTKEPEEKKQEKDSATPKEPELTPEEKHQRKEKEVLFLRHKLQKGLLTREQEPKEEEMEMMSEYIGKLESFPDLEVSIIRATKINKVLKAILKLENIPKESEFKFKPRSQVLLDKWNKLLADVPPEAANGVNGAATKDKEAGAKTNGVKDHSEASKESAKQESKAEEPAAETSATDEVGRQSHNSRCTVY
ncbi:hypothetical protein GQ53DRAFT_370691 [Thozetella sp. PMI_491]|nr:hypothetical protein GQ53DRAFT_370691 [Thozetella sp. PMI_491]